MSTSHGTALKDGSPGVSLSLGRLNLLEICFIVCPVAKQWIGIERQMLSNESEIGTLCLSLLLSNGLEMKMSMSWAV
jgi:hypothetical protein